ncbi:rcc1 and btb domain-containing protein 1 [Lasius niger]|uniref:Rcc1 and btb domain-containing protein 1 n=1 Tax=Lasius niger TaxID=67767 RepID=A0A0J7JUR1_LASNI|nr:rcc1 and btb domain-containing protein 1 [Lasius niger]
MVMVYGLYGSRALIVTKDKNVYALDYNKVDLKIGDTDIDLYPQKIEELCGKNIKTFACNSCFILALTEEGEIRLISDFTAILSPKLFLGSK